MKIDYRILLIPVQATKNPKNSKTKLNPGKSDETIEIT